MRAGEKSLRKPEIVLKQLIHYGPPTGGSHQVLMSADLVCVRKYGVKQNDDC